jgi:hypothetical protein
MGDKGSFWGEALVYEQSLSSKELSLALLGGLLPTYSALQTHYHSQVHMPDYRAFFERWEGSLYQPIRGEVRAILSSLAVGNQGSLLYCAPGSHAPLLRHDEESWIVSRFGQITLLDIDAAALASAKRTLQSIDADVRVEAVSVDFTGPFGQRLCDLYVDALRGAETVTEIVENLRGASPLVKAIFADTSAVLSELSGVPGFAATEQRYDLCVSEMVASFTGTPVWLGFRSALYERFAGNASITELEECLGAATNLWQEYNEHFFGFHLAFLRNRMASSGLILLVFDTQKVYEDPERASIPVFREQFSIIEILAARQLRAFRHTAFSWRDHPAGFDVKLHGVPVSDFQAHTHDIALYVLTAAS